MKTYFNFQCIRYYIHTGHFQEVRLWYATLKALRLQPKQNQTNKNALYNVELSEDMYCSFSHLTRLSCQN